MTMDCPKCGYVLAQLYYYGNHFGEEGLKDLQLFGAQSLSYCGKCRIVCKRTVKVIQVPMIVQEEQR